MKFQYSSMLFLQFNLIVDVITTDINVFNLLVKFSFWFNGQLKQKLLYKW